MKRKNRLIEVLQSYGRIAVAFSGGVDSTFLLAAAVDAVGSENVLAVTVTAPWVPQREQREAIDFCRELGVTHKLLHADAEEIPGFRQNPPDRCYICKYALFSKILSVAADCGGFQVVDGSNVDDTGDYRPGMRALRELKVKSPLMEAGLTKQDIRDLSRLMNLPTWSKPSFACLASRIPYGDEITTEKLKMVELSEQFLLEQGFEQFRVRVHDEVARIELLPKDFQRMLEEHTRISVYKKLQEYGFRYITLDLQGYRTGSLNEILKDKDEK